MKVKTHNSRAITKGAKRLGKRIAKRARRIASKKLAKEESMPKVKLILNEDRCYNCGERFTISDSDLRRAEYALTQGMDGINVVCKSCGQRYTDGLFVEDISDVPDDLPGDSL